MEIISILSPLTDCKREIVEKEKKRERDREKETVKAKERDIARRER